MKSYKISFPRVDHLQLIHCITHPKGAKIKSVGVCNWRLVGVVMAESSASTINRTSCDMTCPYGFAK